MVLSVQCVCFGHHLTHIPPIGVHVRLMQMPCPCKTPYGCGFSLLVLIPLCICHATFNPGAHYQPIFAFSRTTTMLDTCTTHFAFVTPLLSQLLCTMLMMVVFVLRSRLTAWPHCMAVARAQPRVGAQAAAALVPAVLVVLHGLLVRRAPEQQRHRNEGWFPSWPSTSRICRPCFARWKQICSF